MEKCKSPQQLLRTWLKSNPKKRPLEPESLSPFKLNESKSKNENIKNCTYSPHCHHMCLTKDSSQKIPAAIPEHSSSNKSKCCSCSEDSKENVCEKDSSIEIYKHSPQSPHRKRQCVRSMNSEAYYELKDDGEPHKNRQILGALQEKSENKDQVLVSTGCNTCNKVCDDSNLESKEMTAGTKDSNIDGNWLTKHSKYMTNKYGIKESHPSGEQEASYSVPVSQSTDKKSPVSRPIKLYHRVVKSGPR